MSWIIGALLIGLLLNLPLLFEARHRRRLAEARLVIAKTVTRAEELILADAVLGNDPMKEPANSLLYRRMVAAQFTTGFTCRWNLRDHPSEDVRKFRERLQQEMEADSDLGRVLYLHVRAVFRAFTNQHPIKALVFSMWVAGVGGGVMFLIVTLCALIHVHRGFTHLTRGWKKFRKVAAECFICQEFSPNGKAEVAFSGDFARI